MSGGVNISPSRDSVPVNVNGLHTTQSRQKDRILFIKNIAEKSSPIEDKRPLQFMTYLQTYCGRRLKRT
jgi:hypothetical protein